MTTKSYSVSLEKGFVKEAEEWAKSMSGTFNLSGLLNQLLKDWVNSKKLIFKTPKDFEKMLISKLEEIKNEK